MIGALAKIGLFSRGRRRRLRLGLPTLFGLKPGGFFVPYRYADGVAANAYRPSYVAIEERFEASEPTFQQMMGQIKDLASPLESIGNGRLPAPSWKQQWFPPLDAGDILSINSSHVLMPRTDVGSLFNQVLPALVVQRIRDDAACRDPRLRPYAMRRLGSGRTGFQFVDRESLTGGSKSIRSDRTALNGWTYSKPWLYSAPGTRRLYSSGMKNR